MSYGRVTCEIDGKRVEMVARQIKVDTPGASIGPYMLKPQNEWSVYPSNSHVYNCATYTFGGTFKEETMQTHKYLFNVSIWDPREEQFTVLNYPVLVNHSNDQEKAKAQAALDKLEKGAKLDDYDFIVQYFGAVRTKASFEDKK